MLSDRFVEEVLNKHNLDALSEFVHDSHIDHTPAPGQELGLAELRKMFSMYFAAFPDFRATVKDVIAEGDRVALHLITHATHTGEFMGIPPTGKKVEMREIHILRIVDGKAAERWGLIDEVGMMRQLGLMPPAEHGTE